MFKKTKIDAKYLARVISIVVGLVLVWRGIWYILDELDKFLFGGNHFWTALLGTVVGLFVLYLPDGDLKEIEKL